MVEANWRPKRRGPPVPQVPMLHPQSCFENGQEHVHDITRGALHI